MAQVIKRKPTSPGRRFVVSVVDKDLKQIDPQAANRIHPNDSQRITRALEE
jgi:tRNA A37 N6-isopentenylltransferase MiaA